MSSFAPSTVNLSDAPSPRCAFELADNMPLPMWESRSTPLMSKSLYWPWPSFALRPSCEIVVLKSLALVPVLNSLTLALAPEFHGPLTLAWRSVPPQSPIESDLNPELIDGLFGSDQFAPKYAPSTEFVLPRLLNPALPVTAPSPSWPFALKSLNRTPPPSQLPVALK